ncbi:MAG TPA: serine/threonine-protein kinase [Longimicrobiales bacterium]|nr:serine/threonine-protein kinase [Longimicrobiales bacterium]
MREGGRTPERNAEIDRAFAGALNLDPADRTEYLDVLRREDPELAAAVERLLDASARPDARLDPDRWARGRIRGHAGPPQPHRPGDRVGAYRILREIGRGGMSVVYLAERVDGLFEQRVALKFLGVSHEVGVLRFARERRILAGLTHPNIARLLDGGSDDRGRPYIIMEYVDGRPLDVYCNQSGAGLRQRLDLIAVVASAVEYAHRNLVVHRDLKPSNILVTDGQVKLVDFGIAKLLDPPETGGAEPPITHTLIRALTPEYASPEQLRGDRITTASDVYQLGVVLYELLAGCRPWAADGARAAAMERAIREGALVAPSTRVARGRVAPPGLGDARALRQRLRGDLDAIVTKAMAWEPEGRYASVGELRDDLLRFRQGVPVRARPPTTLGAAAKFARRHRTGVAAVVGVALVLAGYATTVTVQSNRLAAEAAKTEQVKDILAGLFTIANPAVSRGEPAASELLDAGARRITELGGQPEVQAELMEVLGRVYGALGHYDEAADLLQRSLQFQRDGPGRSDADLARTAYLLASMRHIQGRLEEAESLLREALGIQRRVLGERSAEVGSTLNELGDLLHSMGRLVEAESVLIQALAIQSSAGSPAMETEGHLGNVYRDRGAFPQAEAHYRRSVAAAEAESGALDPVASLTRSELALLLIQMGRESEADSLLRQNLEVYGTLYPRGHAMMGTTFRNLGILRLHQGQPEEALDLLERAATIYRRTVGEGTPLLPRTRRYVAEALLATGRPEAAATAAAAAISTLSERNLAGHQAVADALEILALARLEQGRPADAVRHLEEALALRERLSVSSDPRLHRTRARLIDAVARAEAARPGAAAGRPDAVVRVDATPDAWR